MIQRQPSTGEPFSNHSQEQRGLIRYKHVLSCVQLNIVRPIDKCGLDYRYIDKLQLVIVIVTRIVTILYLSGSPQSLGKALNNNNHTPSWQSIFFMYFMSTLCVFLPLRIISNSHTPVDCSRYPLCVLCVIHLCVVLFMCCNIYVLLLLCFSCVISWRYHLHTQKRTHISLKARPHEAFFVSVSTNTV